MKFEVTRRIPFCYGHRLLGHQGKCRRLHGHNGVAEVTFRRRALDRMGMVLDFEEIRKTVQAWVLAKLDHRMLLNARDPLVRILERAGEPVVTFQGNPTAESIARRIFDHARSRRLPVSRVRVWETPDSGAGYSGVR